MTDKADSEPEFYAIATRTRAGVLRRVPDTKFSTRASAEAYGRKYHSSRDGSKFYEVVPHPDSKTKSKKDKAMAILDTAAPTQQAAVYIYTSNRGSALTTRKGGKVVNYTLRKGNIFKVKPSLQGRQWISFVVDKLGNIVFDVPVNTARKILGQAKLFKPTTQKKNTPAMHLFTLEQAWMKAKPRGLGKLAARPWYILAKWANIHSGVTVNPTDLLMAAEYNDKGIDDAKKSLLKDLKPYVMQIHRGLKAMTALFKTRLSRKDCIELALYIKNPRNGSPRAKKLMRAHDARWKVNKSSTGYSK